MATADAKTVIAFDYGLNQIGVAVGQTLTATSTPLEVLKARDGQPDWLKLENILKDWQPTLLLVGLPLNMDGSESDFCQRARKFGRRLQGRFGIETKMMDERLSTREAKSRDFEKTGKRRQSYRDQAIDNLAANIILESWLSDPLAAKPP
jgi:putative pre-16S rRNA nuclease